MGHTRAILVTFVLIAFLVRAQQATASLTGTVLDETGAYIPHAALELASGTKLNNASANEVGVYRFSSLIPGEYTLTVRSPGFKARTVKAIHISEGGPDRLLDVPLDVAVMACGQPLILDRILLPASSTFGRLTGAVDPPATGVEVTLVCRTFSACKSAKTDSKGRFTFEDLSPGIYGLNFHRKGFYPENATGYEYTVNAGWESVYAPKLLEKCSNGNCDPKLRPQRPNAICE